MVYDGKTYRNLQDQVAYLTSKYKELEDLIEEVRAQIPSKMIVEELPEEGDPLITYYVGPMGTEPNLYYEVWVWVQEEPDGPFVWRELEDTDQVDLSGYLPKVETVTTYKQVYGKYTDGSQLMMNAAVGQVGNAVVQRNASGQIYVPATPTEYDHAASKQYVDDNFVAKQTGSSTYNQAYAKGTDGAQLLIELSEAARYNALVRRTNQAQIILPNQVDYLPTDDQAISKRFVDSNFLQKRTTATTYPQAYYKKADGTQDTYNMSYNAVDGTIMLRSANGQVMLPNQTTYVPTDDQAVSKRYVDAVVGQLLYLHDIELIITIDATNKLYIKAYLVNGSSTAITEFNRSLYKRIDVQYGAFGPNMANAVAVSVSKLPDGFRQDEFDEPLIGFLYQYISGGNLVSAYADRNRSTTITDIVISW